MALTRGTAQDYVADYAVGQRSFGSIAPYSVVPYRLYNPCGVHLDTSTSPPRLRIFDGGNNRWLEWDWNGIGSWDATAPRMLWGQADYNSAAANGDSGWQNYPAVPTPTSSTMMSQGLWEGSPGESGQGSGFAVDSSGKVYWADPLNNRVLRAARGSTVADYQYGQANFTSLFSNRGGSTAQNSLYLSTWGHNNSAFGLGICVDPSDNLWIPDPGNWRVIVVALGGSTAAHVLGQANFTDHPANPVSDTPSASLSPARMGPPHAVIASATIALVTDISQSRILRFDISGGISDNMNATLLAKVHPGTGVTVSGTTVTDSAANWHDTNQLVGRAVTMGGGATGTITASTTTSFTVGSWTGTPPVNGETYAIAWVRPSAMAWDTVTSNAFWVAEIADSRVYRLDATTGVVQAWKEWAGDLVISGNESCGGGLGVDASGNIFVSIQRWNHAHDVLYFARAEAYNSPHLLFNPPFDIPNLPDKYGLNGPFATTTKNTTQEQLVIVEDPHGRVLFWNLPIIQHGQGADGYLSGMATGDTITGFDQFSGAAMRGACSDGTNLWVSIATNPAQIVRYALPLTTGQTPAQRIILPLNDLEGNAIQGNCGFGLECNSTSTQLYVALSDDSRIIRIKNPLTSPVIDLVLGQADHTGVLENRGGAAAANTLSHPGRMTLRSTGMLVVADNTYEDNGNHRLLEFDASRIAGGASTLYGPNANRAFGATSADFTTGHICAFKAAFSVDGRMILGFSYFGPAPDVNDPNLITLTNELHPAFALQGRFLAYYNSPIACGAPDGYFADYGSMQDGLAFDLHNNLYSSDHNRSIVRVYLTPFGDGSSAPDPTMAKKTTVSIFNNWWPFAKRRWLRNATNVDYNFALGEYGKFQFDLPASDALVQEDIDSMLVGITSDNGVPDFVGRIEAMHEEDGANVTVIGREWIAVLDDRVTSQTGSYTGNAGIAAMSIVRNANAALATGVMPTTPAVATVLASPYDTRSNSVIDALNEIAAATSDEWTRYYTVGQNVQAQLAWQDQVGNDVRGSVHVWDKSLAARTYELDRLNEADAVDVIASTGSYGLRPSATVQTQPSQTFKTTSVTYQARGVPIPKPSVVQRHVSQDDSAAGSQAAAAATAQALSAQRLEDAETINISVGDDVDWGGLALGNVITVRLQRVRFGAGFVTPFRILGIQPDHQKGVCHLVGKVVA